MKKIWRFTPIFFFLFLCFFLWRGLSLDPHELPSVQIGKAVPEFELPKLQNPQVLLSKQQLPKKVYLLNVFASWCESCAQEQMFLLHLAQEGTLIYGLNYKDESQEAQDWLSRWGNPYTLILQDKKGSLALDLGVYGTPETFVIDKEGIIRYRHAGVMTKTLWETDILPLMKQLEQA